MHRVATHAGPRAHVPLLHRARARGSARGGGVSRLSHVRWPHPHVPRQVAAISVVHLRLDVRATPGACDSRSARTRWSGRRVFSIASSRRAATCSFRRASCRMCSRCRRICVTPASSRCGRRYTASRTFSCSIACGVARCAPRHCALTSRRAALALALAPYGPGAPHHPRRRSELSDALEMKPRTPCCSPLRVPDHPPFHSHSLGYCRVERAARRRAAVLATIGNGERGKPSHFRRVAFASNAWALPGICGLCCPQIVPCTYVPRTMSSTRCVSERSERDLLRTANLYSQWCSP